MELYFSPLACSLATRIALYEADAEARYHQANTRTKRLSDGGDFYAVNPMGQVPVLRTDSGELLTENAAVLQYVADRTQAGLAPPPGEERYRLQQWLSFVSTELQKVVFIPLLDETSPEGAKAYARQKAAAPFVHLDKHLEGRDFLLSAFTVADAYLISVLNWCPAVRLDLAEWPTLNAYYHRILQRPAVSRAVAEERALYAEEQARRRAA